MKTSSAIDVVDLEKVYEGGLFGQRVHALKGVTFSVARGEIFGLLGPNGAGKTTLVKILLGIVKKTSGRASMLGFDAGHIEARRHVGYLPEHHRIPRHHTANTALEYYGSLSGMRLADIRRRRPQLLETVGLAEWGKTPIRKFSKGMQQRLGLAQALLHEPDMLILDEPTDGVDPVGRSDMRAVLHALKNDGKTIVINSHLLQEIELICDRVVIIQNGIVRREGAVSELTSTGSASMVLAVKATLDTVRAALAHHTIDSHKELADGGVEFSLTAADQEALDGVVDALLKAGISIVTMTRNTKTLEEAFIGLVKGDEPMADQSSSETRDA